AATAKIQMNAGKTENLRDPGQIRFRQITIAVANAATTSVCPLGKLDPQYQSVSHRSGRARPTAALRRYTARAPLTTETVSKSASKRRFAQRNATPMISRRGSRIFAEPVIV